MLSLKVMSFNVLAASYDQGDVSGWARRKDLNTHVIRAAAPDVIGMQEMGVDNLTHYDEHLPGYHHWLGLTANPYRDSVTPMRNFYRGWWPAIWWKAERFDLVAGGGFYISRTLDASHWYVSHVYDSHYMHPVTWARLADKAEGMEFLCFNTHMHHLARTAGNRPLVGHMLAIASDTTPVIIMGHAYYGRAIPPGAVSDPWRMDWVLVHPGTARLSVQTHTILRDEEPPLYPSDHYPVLAEFTLE